MKIFYISNKYDSKDNIYHDDMDMNVDIKTINSNKCLQLLKTHSLMIFRYDWAIRQYILRLVTPPEDLIPFESTDTKFSKASITNLKNIQESSKISVIKGKIITSKKTI